MRPRSGLNCRLGLQIDRRQALSRDYVGGFRPSDDVPPGLAQITSEVRGIPSVEFDRALGGKSLSGSEPKCHHLAERRIHDLLFAHMEISPSQAVGPMPGVPHSEAAGDDQIVDRRVHPPIPEPSHFGDIAIGGILLENKAVDRNLPTPDLASMLDHRKQFALERDFRNLNVIGERFMDVPPHPRAHHRPRVSFLQKPLDGHRRIPRTAATEQRDHRPQRQPPARSHHRAIISRIFPDDLSPVFPPQERGIKHASVSVINRGMDGDRFGGRQAFDAQIHELEHDLLEMGSWTEQMVGQSVEALRTLNAELARTVMAKDDEIDERDLSIEARCLRLMALQQPTAGDLRRIGTIMKMITDIERVGDLAVDIAKIALKIENEFGEPNFVDLNKMSNEARTMLKLALEAFVRSDVQLVREVTERDELVDNLYRQLREQIFKQMIDEPAGVITDGWLLLAIHHLERVADHAVNIAERVNFIVTGEFRQLTHRMATLNDSSKES